MAHTTHTQRNIDTHRNIRTQADTDIIFTFYTFWLIWHTCHRYKFYICHITDLHMHRHSDMHTHTHIHVQRHWHTDTDTPRHMHVCIHVNTNMHTHWCACWESMELLVQIHF